MMSTRRVMKELRRRDGAGEFGASRLTRPLRRVRIDEIPELGAAVAPASV